MFLEDNMIEDWNQHKLELSPQSTPSTMDLRLVNSTLSANRRLLIDTAKSEWVNLEQLTNINESKSSDLQKSIKAYESESVDLQQLIDMYEHKPNEEAAETSEFEPTMGGGRYTFKQRR